MRPCYFANMTEGNPQIVLTRAIGYNGATRRRKEGFRPLFQKHS